MLRFLWWIVLSAPYCLNAWWMYVPWTVKITYLFFIMFHLCLIGFYSRFIIFHWFVQCALHVLIMFIHVFNCFGMLLLFFIGLFWFWYFFWLFIDICAVLNWMLHHVHWFFNCFFLLRWKWGIQYAHLWSPPQLLTWTMAGKIFFP